MSQKIKQATEPLEHDVPTKPWCSLTLDNFEYKGSLYLIIYDRFTRFIVVKKCADVSACSTILSLLEVFSEHDVLSNIHSDRGRNFVSKEFDIFCKDLGIVLNFSSGYHHSSNQAECAVRTVKDLMKRCDSVGVHWRIALLKFLYTPGPDGVSPSDLMGRQFCDILLMIEKVTNNDVYSDKFSDRKLKEKERFDNKHSRTLKSFTLNTTISYLNTDLKTWSVGSVVSRSPDNRSYHIKTENGQIISCNRVHLCETNVEFVPQVQNILKVAKILKEEKTVKSSSSNTDKSTKPKTVNKHSTVGSNSGCYKARSGHEVRKPPRCW